MASQTDYADVEIRILAKDATGYPVEITVNREQEFPRGYLDPTFLPWVPTASPPADGERLFQCLLGDVGLRRAWAEVRGRWPQRRIHLRIDAAAPELHALPWELLRDPGVGSVPQDLAATVATPFSRYLSGRMPSLKPIINRPIRALAVIPSPANLHDYNLSHIDVIEEWAALREATAGLEVEWANLTQPCTLSALEAELRKGYHVLHFMAHGAYRLKDAQTYLFMADEQDRVQVIHDAVFTDMLGRHLDSDDQLRLVFLASCQTATRSAADSFRGLAPRLVAAGVPAVLAMQDLVPVDTAREFVRTFYHRLLQHGLVDQASNEARSALFTAKIPGVAIPVLFMRLKEGRLFASMPKVQPEIDAVDRNWHTVQAAIQESEKAKAAIGELAQRFQDVAALSRQLGELMRLSYQLGALETDFFLCTNVVESTGVIAQNLKTDDLGKAWSFVRKKSLAELKAFVDEHPHLNTTAWFQPLTEQAGKIDGDLAQLALMSLASSVKTFGDELSRAKARVRQHLEQAVNDLVALCDRTLGRLTER